MAVVSFDMVFQYLVVGYKGGFSHATWEVSLGRCWICEHKVISSPISCPKVPSIRFSQATKCALRK
ncbi:hypothetical protein Taro_016551 [Colocasia esculenta]|uniref:Uncharacterized protein n=1 Tax=Colocasia esculenta TaxID=4460 RepID=A0A843UQI8_COLES|nr:hypothetical protein [Colocasia esculenta]